MPKFKGFLLRWGPLILWMIVLFFASATPGPDIPAFGPWDFVVKKGGHMLGYAVLGVLCRRTWGWQRRPVAAAWLPAVMYALVDEFHQSFVPGRHPSLVDALGFDGVGAALGIFVSWVVYPGRAGQNSKVEGRES
jgi:VanZ family protein